MSFHWKEPITIDQAVERAPCLAAQPHEERSKRYNHVPTTDVLKALESEGFRIFGLSTAMPRAESRVGFQKHLLRLRREDEADVIDNYGEVPELILINSHDGSCSYQLLSGAFRGACANGIIIGNKWLSIRIRHKGQRTVQQVIEASNKVVEEFDYIRDAIENMKEINLDEKEQKFFCQAALNFRYGFNKDRIPVTPDIINRSRRNEDNGNDLWRTYNRVQENMIRGGIQGEIVSLKGKTRKTKVREIKGIDQNVRINQGLFSLAEGYAASLDANRFDNQPLPRVEQLVAVAA